METNVNYTIVGAFVIILSAAIVFSVIWLTSGFSFDHSALYKVYMQESVSGLSIDSQVEFNGVDVGKIKSIEINHQNPQLVELLVAIKNSTPVTKGTVATLKSRGITGLTYLGLIDDGSDLRPLVTEYRQQYPIIKTSPSLFSSLEKIMGQLTKDFHSVAKSIQDLLNKDNQKSIKETLANLKQMTNSLNDTVPETNNLISNLNDVVQTLSTISNDVKQNPSIVIRGVERNELGPGEQNEVHK